MTVFLVGLLFWLCTVASATASAQQPVVTQNFAVFADDAQYANRVAEEAERFRRELAISWLGYELEPWKERCPIRVTIDMHAGGETSFAFMMPPGSNRGEPTGWEMKVFGPPDRLLDAVLPHESYAHDFRNALRPTAATLGRRRCLHDGGARK